MLPSDRHDSLSLDATAAVAKEGGGTARWVWKYCGGAGNACT